MNVKTATGAKSCAHCKQTKLAIRYDSDGQFLIWCPTCGASESGYTEAAAVERWNYTVDMLSYYRKYYPNNYSAGAVAC